VEEKYHFRFASRWGQDDLVHLAVDFNTNPVARVDLIQYMGWSEDNWSVELKKSLSKMLQTLMIGVLAAAAEIESIHISKPQNGTLSPADLDEFR